MLPSSAMSSRPLSTAPKGPTRSWHSLEASRLATRRLAVSDIGTSPSWQGPRSSERSGPRHPPRAQSIRWKEKSTSLGAGVALSHQLVPGMYVRHPDRPAWGLGQVQSAVGNRVTVNFEHVGKQLVNASVIFLIEVDIDQEGLTPPEPGKAPGSG